MSGRDNPSIVSLGGGHGLFATLQSGRLISTDITAIVTVADDGGSSGRLRSELGIIPPGDLRMALAALLPEGERGALWEKLLQHRFRGNGALAGHSAGNLIIAALMEIIEDPSEVLGLIGDIIGAQGRVLPMVAEPLDIEAEVAGIDEDPRALHPIRGQVAVATTVGKVRRVKLCPDDPTPNQEALDTIRNADLVTLGPGSWFSSVIPHVLAPGQVEAINETRGVRALILNLAQQPGETMGFTAEHHLRVLFQHANDLKIDVVVIDSTPVFSTMELRHLNRAADQLGAEIIFASVAKKTDSGRVMPVHDPEKLSVVLRSVLDSRHDGV